MALKSGIVAPLFKAVIDDGSEISLGEFRGKWVVLYFYPKDNTSGCTQEACDFRDNMERLTLTGAEVIGVSPDSVKSHQGFKSKYNLNFHLISDVDKIICNKYKVIGEKTLYGRKYMGIIRSTFIISPVGKISDTISPVTVKGHVEEVIKILSAKK